MWEKVGMRWGPALTPVGCATHHRAGIVLLATCCLLLRVLSPNSVCPLSFSLRLRAASCVSAGSPPASAAPPSPSRPLSLSSSPSLACPPVERPKPTRDRKEREKRRRGLDPLRRPTEEPAGASLYTSPRRGRRRRTRTPAEREIDRYGTCAHPLPRTLASPLP